DNPFNAVFAQHARHADEVAADPVFLVAIGSARQDALLVLDDRLGHRHGGGGGGVVGGAFLQQLDDLGPAVAGPLGDLVEPVLADELRDRDAADRGEAHQRHHVVAVAAQQEGVNVLDAAPNL